MNALDIFFVVILCYCLIRGIFRGIIKELSSIVGVLAGYYAAYTYYPLVTGLLDRWISSTAYLQILSFAIIFCLVFLLISIMGVVIKYLLQIAFLGWADRICGATFGILKGVLITAVILVALTAFLPRNAGLIRDSLLAPHITMISENLARIVTHDMKQRFRVKLESLKTEWQRL